MLMLSTLFSLTAIVSIGHAASIMVPVLALDLLQYLRLRSHYNLGLCDWYKFPCQASRVHTCIALRPGG